MDNASFNLQTSLLRGCKVLYQHRAALVRALRTAAPTITPTTILICMLIAFTLSSPVLAQILAVMLLVSCAGLVSTIAVLVAYVDDEPIHVAEQRETVAQQNTSVTELHDGAVQSQRRMATALGIVPDVADLFRPLTDI